jgi:hypothetical protein
MTVTTLYGGSDTSYVESNGVPLGHLTMDVYAARTGGSPMTNLVAVAADGSTSPATSVQSDALGFYEFGVVGTSPGGPVYLDSHLPGSYRKKVFPADLADRLVSIEQNLAALVQASVPVPTDTGSWAASHAYAAGNYFTAPDGSRWQVAVAYTSGPSFAAGGLDGSKAIMTAPAAITGYLTATTANGLYAPISSAYQQVIAWDGGDLRTGFDLDPNGIDMGSSGQINQCVIDLDLPVTGADGIVHFYRLNSGSGGNTETDFATVTVTNGQVQGVTTLATPLAYAKKDKIGIRVTQVGSTFAGRGLKARIMLGTETVATITAPGTPTALTITGTTSNSASMSWASGTNSSQAIIYRDGIPYWNVGTLTTFTDLGPDGLGLGSSENHTYAVQARRYSSLSAISASVGPVGPTVTASWLPQADGALNPAMVNVIRGANVPSGNVNVSANVLQITGTAVTGGNAQADRVLLKHVGGDGAVHPAFRVDMLARPDTSSTQWEIYLGATDFNLSGTSTTNYVVAQCTTGGVTFGGKMGTWVPASGTGTGTTAGTFQRFSDTSTYPVDQFNGTLTRTAGGSISWPGGALNTTTSYGWRFELLAKNGDGTRYFSIRKGSATEYAANPGTMTLVGTLQLTNAQVAGMSAGYVFLQLLAQSTVGGTPYGLKVYDFDVTALAAVGS